MPKRYAHLAFILALFLVATLGLQTVHAQEVDLDRLLPELESNINHAMREGHIPSMTIALVSGDKVIWSKGYGHSNLWARTEAVPNTVYLIGSTFKAQSTFALLQQMDQKKFALDDPVSDYLPAFKIRDEDPNKPITFRHLLTHVSGIPGGFGGHDVWGDTVPGTLEEYLKGALRTNRPPMEKYEYSNIAFTLIAYLIEQFSGQDYKTYIQENIWQPLEMIDTAFAPRPDMQERLAIPYAFDSKTKNHSPTARLKADVWPAGIVYGTVLDQANWIVANLNRGSFKNKQVLRKKTVNKMMSRQYDVFTGPVSDYWLNDMTGNGLTWWISQHNGDTLFAHSGSVPGYTAWNLGNLDQKVGVAILTNGHRAHPHLAKLSMEAMELLIKHKR